jgi:hypothetical protein
MIDVTLGFADQLAHAAEETAAEGLAADEAEPALNC